MSRSITREQLWAPSRAKESDDVPTRASACFGRIAPDVRPNRGQILLMTEAS